MPEDSWQGPEPQDTGGGSGRRSPAVRVGRLLVVAAAFATVGIGGVASASADGTHEGTIPSRVSVHDASVGGVATHHCPFHSRSRTASPQG